MARKRNRAGEPQRVKEPKKAVTLAELALEAGVHPLAVRKFALR